MFGRLYRDLGGNVAMMFGLGLPVLGISMGFAVDYSNSTYQRTEMQNAADAAALAGARELGFSDGQPTDKRENLAIAAAERFLAGKVPQAQGRVEPSLDRATVRVQLSYDSPQYFGGLIGQTSWRISVAAEATYLGQDIVSGCVIALGANESAGIAIEGAPRLTARNCGVWSNAAGGRSITAQGAPRVDADRICAVGQVDGSRGLNPTPEAGCEPAPDPYAGRVLSVDAGCDWNNRVVESKTPVTLDAPTYCGGLFMEGGTIKLNPGLYVVRDGPLTIAANANLTGNGVSILLVGEGADLLFRGSPSVTLTAMASGPLAGIAIAMAADGLPKTAIMEGSPNLAVAGSLYLPGASLTLRGSPSIAISGKRDKLVALSFLLQGSPKINIEAEDTEERGADLANLG